MQPGIFLWPTVQAGKLPLFGIFMFSRYQSAFCRFSAFIFRYQHLRYTDFHVLLILWRCLPCWCTQLIQNIGANPNASIPNRNYKLLNFFDSMLLENRQLFPVDFLARQMAKIQASIQAEFKFHKICWFSRLFAAFRQFLSSDFLGRQIAVFRQKARLHCSPSKTKWLKISLNKKRR